ncbi:MAG: universal stress protein [Deferrisomatales bacterium]
MQILVGYDGSRASQRALEWAKQRALALGAKVHLVSCYEQKVEVTRHDLDTMKAEEARLQEAAKGLKAAQVECVAEFIGNNLTAGETLVDYAADHQIDEIVMGVQTTSRVGKLLFGSTAQYVILKAHCPVTSVKATP